MEALFIVTRSIASLQAHPGADVIAEKLAIPNVAAHHLHRFVARLTHDMALFSAVLGGRCGQARPQAMPTIISRIGPNGRHRAFNRPRHRFVGQAAGAHGARLGKPLDSRILASGECPELAINGH